MFQRSLFAFFRHPLYRPEVQKENAMWKLLKWILLAIIMMMVALLAYFAAVDTPPPSQPVERTLNNDPATH
jgi:hypothetical protein